MLHSRKPKKENKRNTQFVAYESKIKRENVGVEDERVYVREEEEESGRKRERGWGGGEEEREINLICLIY
jgi:hypothetical protein